MGDGCIIIQLHLTLLTVAHSSTHGLAGPGMPGGPASPSPSNPPLSDSLSPSIHSVSLLQLSGCTAAGARTEPHSLQSPPCLPLMFPILCRELAARPQLSLNGAISPWPFSPQVPRPAPHMVPCSMGLPQGGGVLMARVPREFVGWVGPYPRAQLSGSIRAMGCV